MRDCLCCRNDRTRYASNCRAVKGEGVTSGLSVPVIMGSATVPFESPTQAQDDNPPVPGTLRDRTRTGTRNDGRFPSLRTAWWSHYSLSTKSPPSQTPYAFCVEEPTRGRAPNRFRLPCLFWKFPKIGTMPSPLALIRLRREDQTRNETSTPSLRCDVVHSKRRLSALRIAD